MYPTIASSSLKVVNPPCKLNLRGSLTLTVLGANSSIWDFPMAAKLSTSPETPSATLSVVRKTALTGAATSPSAPLPIPVKNPPKPPS